MDIKALFSAVTSRIIVIIICLAMIGAVAYLVIRGEKGDREVIEETVEDSSASVNVARVIDATGRRQIEAREGYRYRVIVEDESRDGVAGVTHIGGLVTFIKGDARPGELLVVEVTRLKKSTAEAVIIERLGTRKITAARQARGNQHRPRQPVNDKIYRATVEDIGKKGDSIVHLNGKVVFLPGGTVGEEVIFCVVDDRENFAVGRLMTLDEVGDKTVVNVERGRSRHIQQPASTVSDGQLYRATIEDIGKKGDAIVHLDGKVVFLPGGKVGQEVVFTITQERERFLTGRILSDEEAAGKEVKSAASAAPASVTKEKLSVDGKWRSDEVQPGAVFDVTIEEKDRKNPDRNGVVRIGGLVVFVSDSQPGETHKIRIIERADRFAKAEKVEDL